MKLGWFPKFEGMVISTEVLKAAGLRTSHYKPNKARVTMEVVEGAEPKQKVVMYADVLIRYAAH
jgi:hypothetical protein